jgi:hypothetical protein
VIIAFALLILNFVISWWNAYAVGRTWHESKNAGGMARVLAWSGAIMSASGFTFVYAVIMSMIAAASGLIPAKYAQAAMELAYLLVILPIIGSGLAIWADSVAQAYKQRSFASVGVATWNTYAQASNIYNATRDIPSAWSHVSGLLNSDDDEDNSRAVIAVLLIVIASLAGGCLTTYAIVRSASRIA